MNKPNALWTLITLQKSDKSWFKAKEMEVNKLNTLMKTMAEKAGLDNSHLTNHSARNKLFKQSKAVLVRFVKNKLVRKYRTSALSMNNSIYIPILLTFS